VTQPMNHRIPTLRNHRRPAGAQNFARTPETRNSYWTVFGENDPFPPPLD
jgi:hypothetical protein